MTAAGMGGVLFGPGIVLEVTEIPNNKICSREPLIRLTQRARTIALGRHHVGSHLQHYPLIPLTWGYFSKQIFVISTSQLEHLHASSAHTDRSQYHCNYSLPVCGRTNFLETAQKGTRVE